MENKMTNQVLQAALQSVKNMQEGSNIEKLIEDLYPDLLHQTHLWHDLMVKGFVEIKSNVPILTDTGKEKLNQLKNGRT
jgi:hypothetical protein